MKTRNAKDWSAATIIGRSTLRDGEIAECDHCGRQITNLVHTTLGVIGQGCAMKHVRGASRTVKRAPLITSRSVDEAIASKQSWAMHNGCIVRVYFRRDGETVIEPVA